VEQAGGKVEVSYFENGELVTVAGRAAIIACPKFIAKRIIRGLDDDHARAMGAMRYAPYLVVNACTRQVIYNGSYDTNIPARARSSTSTSPTGSRTATTGKLTGRRS